jgi:hypothetical protein
VSRCLSLPTKRRPSSPCRAWTCCRSPSIKDWTLPDEHLASQRLTEAVDEGVGVWPLAIGRFCRGWLQSVGPQISRSSVLRRPLHG